MLFSKGTLYIFFSQKLDLQLLKFYFGNLFFLDYQVLWNFPKKKSFIYILFTKHTLYFSLNYIWNFRILRNSKNYSYLSFVHKTPFPFYFKKDTLICIFSWKLDLSLFTIYLLFYIFCYSGVRKVPIFPFGLSKFTMYCFNIFSKSPNFIFIIKLPNFQLLGNST